MKPATLQDWADRLEKAYAGAVHDVLRAMGRPVQVLPREIAPLQREHVLAGPVFTVAGRKVPGLSAEDSLLQWTTMLSRAPRGFVVVCQPNDDTIAHMGELSAETFSLRGVRGYVVDGGCRDTAFIQRLGFKVFCRYTTPIDVVGRWRADAFDEPVVIGAVRINPGDFIFADRDGIIVIPREIVEEVVVGVENVMRTESLVRRAIVKEGMDPKEAYLKYGKF